MLRFITFLLGLVLMPMVLAAPAAPSAAAEITALLAKLDASGCQFNRNGIWYTASEAKAHLLRKLEYLEGRGTLRSAEQFIELAASKSSITGQPYLVRCENAAPVQSSIWLSSELQEIRSSAPGPQVRLRTETVSRMKDVYVVPMETPPLTIDSSYATTGSASIVHFLPRYSIGTARAVGTLSAIVVLLELPEMSQRRLEYPPSAQIQIKPSETWPLSVELAQEAGRILAASGRLSTISSEIQPIPGIQDKGRTAQMENRMAPIRTWYNDTLPSTRYAALTVKGMDVVAEVGISNYEIFSGKLLLQVHLKLIDPESGQLLGRARALSYTELPSMDEAFAADAKVFKESVSRAGNQLIATCLREIGLVSK